MSLTLQPIAVFAATSLDPKTQIPTLSSPTSPLTLERTAKMLSLTSPTNSATVWCRTRGSRTSRGDSRTASSFRIRCAATLTLPAWTSSGARRESLACLCRQSRTTVLESCTSVRLHRIASSACRRESFATQPDSRRVSTTSTSSRKNAPEMPTQRHASWAKPEFNCSTWSIRMLSDVGTRLCHTSRKITRLLIAMTKLWFSRLTLKSTRQTRCGSFPTGCQCSLSPSWTTPTSTLESSRLHSTLSSKARCALQDATTIVLLRWSSLHSLQSNPNRTTTSATTRPKPSQLKHFRQATPMRLEFWATQHHQQTPPNFQPRRKPSPTTSTTESRSTLRRQPSTTTIRIIINSSKTITDREVVTAVIQKRTTGAISSFTIKWRFLTTGLLLIT